MKKSVMQKWVKALRSGKYKQGQDQLKIPGKTPKFCCLGVLCDIAPKTLGKFGPGGVYITHGATITRYEMHIPPAIQDWSGVREHNGACNLGTGCATTLTAMNDGINLSAAASFEQIADFIEKNYEAL